jgi:CRISPR type IV-associated protein Csf3
MVYRPLVVEARLGSPYVGDPTAPLDGILLYAAMSDLYSGELPAWEPGQTAEYDPAIVPLQVVNPGPDWFYACSFAQWGAYTEDVDHWNKRFDMPQVDFLSDKTRKLEIGSGPYKAYYQQIYYRHALSLWWCCVGDQDRIGELLKPMDHIGKKTSQGWGHVIEWRITWSDHDYSLFDANGYAMRAIPSIYYYPLLDTEGFKSVPININFAGRGFRPPYWAKENQGKCIVP